MSDPTNSRELFSTFKDTLKPVKMVNVSPMKSAKRFFNAKYGASVTPLDIDDIGFNPDDQVCLTAEEILENQPDGLFDVTGQIKWLEYAREANCFGENRKLREGKFLDSSEYAYYHLGRQLIYFSKRRTNLLINKPCPVIL